MALTREAKAQVSKAKPLVRSIGPRERPTGMSDEFTGYCRLLLHVTGNYLNTRVNAYLAHTVLGH